MCPFCVSTLGMIISGSVSTGGLAAFAVEISSKKNSTSEVQNSTKGENNYDDTEK